MMDREYCEKYYYYAKRYKFSLVHPLNIDSLKAKVNSDRNDKVDYNPYSEYTEDYDEVYDEEND